MRLFSSRANEGSSLGTPPRELVEQAKLFPGGWVYEIDGDMVSDPEGDVPMEAIIGAWKVDSQGQLTSEHWENPGYRPS